MSTQNFALKTENRHLNAHEVAWVVKTVMHGQSQKAAVDASARTHAVWLARRLSGDVQELADLQFGCCSGRSMA